MIYKSPVRSVGGQSNSSIKQNELKTYGDNLSHLNSLMHNSFRNFSGIHRDSNHSMMSRQMAQNLKKTPGTSLGLMKSVKDNNSQCRSLNQNYNRQADGPKSIVAKNHNNAVMNLQALMLQKGLKCKCPNDNIFYTKNEDSKFEEVSMDSL